MRHARHSQSFPRALGRLHRARAFTVVELLVVIGVISILIAILLPALRSVRVQARMTTETSHARQLMVGYLAYANVHQDRVLPGYTHGNDPIFDAGGSQISGVPSPARGRYPLRLALYLDFDIRVLVFGDHQQQLEDFLAMDRMDEYYYHVSLLPSLGLNTQWVGGDFSTQPPGLLSPRDGQFNLWNQLYDLSRYYVSRTSQVRSPERLLVFASSRFQDSDSGITVEGHHRILSPYTTAGPDEEPESRWTDMFLPNHPPSSYGNLSLRYNGRAVTTFFDGSVGALDQYELRDMRRWSNWATHPNWAMPRTQ